MNIINKLGILIENFESYNMYKNFLSLLKEKSFEVFLSPHNKSEINNLIDYAVKNNFDFSTNDDFMVSKSIYKYFLSHSPFSHINSIPVKDLGLHHIRYMYGLGYDNHHFDFSYNNIYDLILCFGPYQKEKLSYLTNTIKLEIGYPRYDYFYNKKIDYLKIMKKLKCDLSKKNIIWFATLNEISSFEIFGECVSKLMDEYNIILKPHPLDVIENHKRIEFIESLNFTYIVKESIDNTELFSIADYIFADYGGTIFGALYTDNNILLLNIKDIEKNEKIGLNSSDIFIRKDIINFDLPDAELIRNKLKDKNYWTEQKSKRENLRNLFFAPYYGFSSIMISNILNNIDKILHQNNNILFNKALNNMKNGDYINSINIFQTLLSNGEKSNDIYYLLAKCIKEIGDIKTSEIFFNKANELE